MMREWVKVMLARIGIVVGALMLASCATSPAQRNFETEFVLAEAALQKDISILASDEFMGRRPITEGEEKTLSFIQSELEKAGLVSGTNDPSNPWRAPVALVTTAALSGNVMIRVDGKDVLFNNQEAAALSGSKLSLVEKGELVFVGLAIGDVPDEAVNGKVVILLGEPGKSPPRRARLFEQGAGAVITIVETSQSVIQMQMFAGRERFRLASEVDNNLSVFVTREAMSRAISNWDVLEKQARENGKREIDFVPVTLPATVRIEASTDRRDAISHNLIAKLPGTNPDAGAVLMLAHWDHFGECGELGDEDRVCNGAVDNASGVASMLELARRLSKSGPHDRDIYVLGTTAEEWGLLGAIAFAENPPIPRSEFIAAFNFDTVAIAPRGSEIGFIGEGSTPLDDIVLEAIKASGRKQGSRVLAQQFLQRQDGWALLERDVPTVMVTSAFGNEDRLNDYIQSRYHKAGDDIVGLELGGAVEDLLLHEALITKIANANDYGIRIEVVDDNTIRGSITVP